VDPNVVVPECGEAPLQLAVDICSVPIFIELINKYARYDGTEEDGTPRDLLITLLIALWDQTTVPHRRYFCSSCGPHRSRR